MYTHIYIYISYAYVCVRVCAQTETKCAKKTTYFDIRQDVTSYHQITASCRLLHTHMSHHHQITASCRLPHTHMSHHHQITASCRLLQRTPKQNQPPKKPNKTIMSISRKMFLERQRSRMFAIEMRCWRELFRMRRLFIQKCDGIRVRHRCV